MSYQEIFESYKVMVCGYYSYKIRDIIQEAEEIVDRQIRGAMEVPRIIKWVNDEGERTVDTDMKYAGDLFTALVNRGYMDKKYEEVYRRLLNVRPSEVTLENRRTLLDEALDLLSAVKALRDEAYAVKGIDLPKES
ncbi:hypothetical protein ACFQ4C_17975 [Larkinella insperata]|uniref:Uncharacterized protein n=1 Tax=Larkinella insperata TaxID=332158 RepID=A0ABW3QH38_9BACT|nr:hypothetical protein [Larkinella insperata]